MTVVRDPRIVIPSAAWRHRVGAPIASGRPRVDTPMIDDGPTGGVPVGGIGAGSIGRTCDGDFARWHLRIGTHHYAPSAAGQFSVFVSSPSRPAEAHVLSTLRPAELSAWQWDMPSGVATYHALFPRAWIEYEWPVPGVRLVQRQLSPVLPHNYREASYPVGLFSWSVDNTTDEPVRVALMFTWPALDEDAKPSRANARIVADAASAGVILDNGRDTEGRPLGQFALLAAKEDGAVSMDAGFHVDDGASLWRDFSLDGALDGTNDLTHDGLGAALAVTLDVPAHDSRRARFALAWDFPLMRFGSGRAWYRRYTRFFGRDGNNAAQIAREALAREDAWDRAIEAWQSPILDDTRRPSDYAMALFNELYVVVDGGTAWEDGMEGEPSPRDGDGGFAILECFDYPFYNTHDVIFYASWAFAANWPVLEARIARSMAQSVAAVDARLVDIEATRARARRKDPGTVAHDIGAPFEDPWFATNGYHHQDPNTWKDLSSKFVLQLFRDATLLGRADLLADAWPSVVSALDRLAAADRDGDGLPEHDGADQTFDTWTMSGPSAYAGGLYVAALAAAERMAGIVGDDAVRARYSERRDRAAAALRARLWNGRYLLYDGGTTASSDSVMADQLCGLWWCDATGLPPYLADDEVRSALRTIFERNVDGVGARLGAVNGTRPDGSVDLSSEQSQECWPGVTYFLAAHLLARGLEDEAWLTAKGAIRTTYEGGFQFRTPEAWDERGNFRASIYLRPLAIWAIEHALAITSRSERGP